MFFEGLGEVLLMAAWPRCLRTGHLQATSRLAEAEKNKAQADQVRQMMEGKSHREVTDNYVVHVFNHYILYYIVY